MGGVSKSSNSENRARSAYIHSVGSLSELASRGFLSHVALVVDRFGLHFGCENGAEARDAHAFLNFWMLMPLSYKIAICYQNGGLFPRRWCFPSTQKQDQKKQENEMMVKMQSEIW